MFGLNVTSHVRCRARPGMTTAEKPLLALSFGWAVGCAEPATAPSVFQEPRPGGHVPAGTAKACTPPAVNRAGAQPRSELALGSRLGPLAARVHAAWWGRGEPAWGLWWL